MKTKILIVDDHDEFRKALNDFLDNQNLNLEMYTADSETSAVALASKIKPDIVLLELQLPKMNGIKTSRLIKDVSSKSKIAIVSTFDTEKFKNKFTDAHIDAFVGKSEFDSTLLRVLKKYLKGGGHKKSHGPGLKNPREEKMRISKTKFRRVAAAVLFMTVPALMFGQSLHLDDKVLSIGVRSMNSKPKDADKGKWFVGAQARVRLLPSLKAEGSIDVRNNEYDRYTKITVYPVQASLLAYLMPEERWSPFLLAGAGWYYTRVKSQWSYSDTQNRFGLHAGVGAEVMINENLSLDGTYRYVWLESVRSMHSNAFYKNYRDSGSMFTIALNILF